MTIAKSDQRKDQWNGEDGAQGLAWLLDEAMVDQVSQGDRAVWIGLLEVKPLPGSDLLEGAPGAYVNVLTTAGTYEEYYAKANAALSEAGFDVVGVGDDPAPEPLYERVKNHAVEADLLAMADDLSGTEEVRFDIFHAWQSEDEEER